MQYGHFDDEKREYVIDRVDLPTSWTNYLGVEDTCVVVNHTAGGYMFYKTPEYHRITRFRGNAVPMDRPGHYVYLRDAASGDNLELWDVRVKNEGKETRDLQVFSYCEFSFHHIMIDNQNFQMSLYCAGSSCEDGIIEHDLFYEEFGYQYFTMSEKPDGFDCLRDKKGKEARAKYSDPKAVDKAYEALQSYWKNKLDKLQIHTPHNDAVCTVTE